MLKKFFAFTFAAMVAVTFFCAAPAEAVRQSSFDYPNNFCTVTISDQLLNKRGKQYAKVTLLVKDIGGRKNNGKVDIIMTDEHGRPIWSGVKNGGVTLNLGDDHRIYRIYVRKHYDGGDNPNFIQQGNNFTNRGKCVTWEFVNEKNCRIN